MLGSVMTMASLVAASALSHRCIASAVERRPRMSVTTPTCARPGERRLRARRLRAATRRPDTPLPARRLPALRRTNAPVPAAPAALSCGGRALCFLMVQGWTPAVPDAPPKPPCPPGPRGAHQVLRGRAAAMAHGPQLHLHPQLLARLGPQLRLKVGLAPVCDRRRGISHCAVASLHLRPQHGRSPQRADSCPDHLHCTARQCSQASQVALHCAAGRQRRWPDVARLNPATQPPDTFTSTVSTALEVHAPYTSAVQDIAPRPGRGPCSGRGRHCQRGGPPGAPAGTSRAARAPRRPRSRSGAQSSGSRTPARRSRAPR